MEGYRVCFPEKGKAILKSVNVREPKSDEVIIKIEKSLISAGTEKACILGLENTPVKYPSYPGYSSVGIVLKTGSNVKEFKEGERVFCSYGGHGNYNVVNKNKLTKIPDNVSFEEAVFLKIISYPLLALRHARVELGESVVVVGLGMLGLFAVQIARLLAVPLIGVGNREIRRQKALDYGANYVFDPSEPDLTDKIIQICEKTNGIKGANVIIETSGQIDALNSCLTYASKGARVMLNGCNRITDKPINLYEYIHRKGVSLIGAHEQTRLPSNSAPGNWTARRDYTTIFRMLEDGRLNAKDMMSEMVSPKDTALIYERLINDRDFPLGVVFDWKDFH